MDTSGIERGSVSRFERLVTGFEEQIAMNLREHLTEHPGQYTLAESHRPLTVDMLSDLMLREEVAVYSVGQDAGGASKSHLYVRNTVHIATLVEAAALSQGETPHGHSTGPVDRNAALALGTDDHERSERFGAHG